MEFMMKKIIIFLLIFCSCTTIHIEKKEILLNPQDAQLGWQRAHYYVYNFLGYGLNAEYHDCVISTSDIIITREASLLKISYYKRVKVNRNEIKKQDANKKSVNPYIEQKDIVEYSDSPDPAQLTAMKEFVDKMGDYIKTGQLK